MQQGKALNRGLFQFLCFLICLHRPDVKPENHRYPAETSAGGGDLEGDAEVVNAVFSRAVRRSRKAQKKSASTPNAIKHRKAAPNDMTEATAV